MSDADDVVRLLTALSGGRWWPMAERAAVAAMVGEVDARGEELRRFLLVIKEHTP